MTALGPLCNSWLDAWTGNRPETLLSFYTEDAFYRDPAKPTGLKGHAELRAYFTKLLAKNPDWVWKPLEIIPTEKGFALKWEAAIPQGDRTIRETGLDLVELRDGMICRNEVYFDPTRLTPSRSQQDNKADKGVPMKLFYSPGSCSTSCHITLEESGLPYEAVAVDWDNPQDPNLGLIKKLNPLGTLPVFLADKGMVLAQNLAIHAYVSDRVPSMQLLPPSGTLERAEAMHWLSFVASDLHKSFSPLFGLANISPDKNVQEAVRNWSVAGVKENLAYLESRLAGRDYVMGKTFTAVDAYCFIVVNWTNWLGISLAEYPNIQAYLTRVKERPAVQKVYAEEGL